MSDVPRSLQSWVSTIHTVVLTADVFQLLIKNPTFFAGGVNSRRWGRAGPSRRRLAQPALRPAGDIFKITSPSPTRSVWGIPIPRDVGPARPASFQSHWSSARPGP